MGGSETRLELQSSKISIRATFPYSNMAPAWPARVLDVVLEMHFGVGFVNFEANFQRILIVFSFRFGNNFGNVKIHQGKTSKSNKAP